VQRQPHRQRAASLLANSAPDLRASIVTSTRVSPYAREVRNKPLVHEL